VTLGTAGAGKLNQFSSLPRKILGPYFKTLSDLQTGMNIAGYLVQQKLRLKKVIYLSTQAQSK
jgi:hypothetical protein